MTRTALTLALCLAAAPALAAPPPGADPNSEIAHWVHSLKKRSTGGGCCDFSDCRHVMVRPGTHGDMEAFIGVKEFGETAPDQWVTIPQEVLDNTMADGPSPDGGNWVCWYGSRVFCAYLSELF